jgi:osmotically-inducible protein OsmY
MEDNNHLANRFGEKNISIPSHDPTSLIYEDEYGMTREEEVEELDWSHDPRSESFNEGHSQERFKDNITDDFISQHTRIALSLSPELTTQFIEVKVIQGCVYLDGFVQSRRQKKAAENCVENLCGVTDVFNRLNIPHH